MWASLLGDAEKAKERFASALEKTGDMLNERAKDHSTWLKKETEKRVSQSIPKDPATTTPTTTSPNGNSHSDSNSNSQGGDGDGDGDNDGDTIEYSSEILIEEQTDLKQGQATTSTTTLAGTGTATSMPLKQLVDQKDEMLKHLQFGWGNMVNATRNTLVEAQQLFQKNPLYRDLSLPLDVEALKDAEVVYATDRLITMGHPYMQSSVDGDITAERKLAAVAHLLKKRHAGRFMVWNLSEVEYEYGVFDNEVLPFHFPGSPSPPLGMLLKLLLSIESWLKADPLNVAVFHCLTGKGRTSTVLACFLCWTGEAGFHDPIKALDYIATCKRVSSQGLTIPSQRRYASYFSNMLDGVRPHQPPLVLKRIIMSVAPQYAKPPSPRRKDDMEAPSNGNVEDEIQSFTNQLGCSPYLQIFKAGKLLFTTTANMNGQQDEQTELPFCVPSDGPISFPTEVVIQGDILIRCRHLTKRGKRISMFRAAFHTGYVATTKVLRLTKGQLDGACTDRRFQEDFFLDLIFEACDASVAGKHLVEVDNAKPSPSSSTEATEGTPATPLTDGNTLPKMMKKIASTNSIGSNEANDRRNGGTLSTAGTRTTDSSLTAASTYDSMLHRDSRFWDVIATRRNEHFSNAHANSDQFQDGSAALAGPTVGRRRDFTKVRTTHTKDDGSSSSTSMTNSSSMRRSSIDTFSIGDGFSDAFLGDTSMEQTTKKTVEDDSKKKTKAAKEKDSLMEALMALNDDDELEDDDDMDLEDDDDDDNNNDNVNDDVEEQDSDMIQEVISFEKGEDGDSKTGISDVSMTSDKGVLTGSDTGVKTKDISKEDDVSNDKGKEEKESVIDEPPLNDTMDTDEMEAVVDGAYDFDDDDDDDEELEDLENFLTKKK